MNKIKGKLVLNYVEGCIVVDADLDEDGMVHSRSQAINTGINNKMGKLKYMSFNPDDNNLASHEVCLDCITHVWQGACMNPKCRNGKAQ